MPDRVTIRTEIRRRYEIDAAQDSQFPPADLDQWIEDGYQDANLRWEMNRIRRTGGTTVAVTAAALETNLPTGVLRVYGAKEAGTNGRRFRPRDYQWLERQYAYFPDSPSGVGIFFYTRIRGANLVFGLFPIWTAGGNVDMEVLERLAAMGSDTNIPVWQAEFHFPVLCPYVLSLMAERDNREALKLRYFSEYLARGAEMAKFREYLSKEPIVMGSLADVRSPYTGPPIPETDILAPP